MRLLVTWGSKSGGTAGIAHTLSAALRDRGVDTVDRPADDVRALDGFDAVIVGGALYANRWHAAARRFVNRHIVELRRLPVWFFSSGPLDDSAARTDIPPTRQVAVLMGRSGAQGHVTFGGRLTPAARGFPARAMATKSAGDWRDSARIGAWAAEIARALPSARPAAVTRYPGRSLGRLVAHGLVIWAVCSAVMGALLATWTKQGALVLHDLFVPIASAAVARHYFRAAGAREPLPTALAFVAIAALLDVSLVAAVILRDFAMVHSVVGFWLPLLLLGAVTWATGAIMSMMPDKPVVAGAPGERR